MNPRPPKVSIIVAANQFGAIGAGGTIPWHFKEDLQHFKAFTQDKPILMGRKTWESIPGKLPGRQVCVLTRDPLGYDTKLGTDWVSASLPAMLRFFEKKDELVICGGQRLYEECIAFADEVQLTRVTTANNKAADFDTFFPLERLQADFDIVEHRTQDLVDKKGNRLEAFEVWRRK